MGCLYFFIKPLSTLLEAREELFRSFLEELKARKIAFEIFWPLKCTLLQVLANVKGVDLNKIDVIHNDWNAFHYAILQDNVAALEILLGTIHILRKHF